MDPYTDFVAECLILGWIWKVKASESLILYGIDKVAIVDKNLLTLHMLKYLSNRIGLILIWLNLSLSSSFSIHIVTPIDEFSTLWHTICKAGLLH